MKACDIYEHARLMRALCCAAVDFHDNGHEDFEFAFREVVSELKEHEAKFPELREMRSHGDWERVRKEMERNRRYEERAVSAEIMVHVLNKRIRELVEREKNASPHE